jgi:hypothetical protein
MKRYISILYFFGLGYLLITCTKEEYSIRNYPRVATHEIENVNSSGATFKGEVISQGKEKIIEYGFTWGEYPSPKLETANKKVVKGESSSAIFKTEISTALKDSTTYYVRAFAKTESFIVYGKNVSFISLGSSAPTITRFNPEEGTIGDTISIYGYNFSYLSKENNVKFGDIATSVLMSSDTLVKVLVPDISDDAYYISLSILGNTAKSEELFHVSTPVIISFNPTTCSIDDTLEIVGVNFSLDENSNILTIGNSLSEVIYSSKNLIKAIIPYLDQEMNIIQLTIANNTTSSNDKLVFKPPTVLGVKPNAITFGDTIEVSGESFSPVLNNNILKWGTTEVLPITGSSTILKYIIPDDLDVNGDSLILSIKEFWIELKGFYLKPPQIHTVTPNEITKYQSEVIEIVGENFNPIISKNLVSIGGRTSNLISAEKNKLIVEFPIELIADKEFSQYDSVDLVVQVLNQSDTLSDGIFLNYTSRWLRKNDFPGRTRIESAHFSINGKGYIGFGWDGDHFNPTSDEFLKDLWEYDPINDTWARMPDLPAVGRSEVTFFVLNEKAYIIGGFSTYPYGQFNNEVWEFNPVNDQWIQKNDFPGIPRCQAFGFSVDGKGYMGRGMVEGGGTTYEFWEYNPGSDSWTLKGDLYDAGLYGDYKGGDNG